MIRDATQSRAEPGADVGDIEVVLDVDQRTDRQPDHEVAEA
jgi:hypothetical protein